MPYTRPFATSNEDPFYNQQDQRRDRTQDWTKTPVIGGPAGYLEQNQDAEWTRLMGTMGVGLSDASPFARYVADQFRNAQIGYKALLAEHPTLKWQDYIRTLGGVQDFRARFNALSSRARGVYLPGPTRTIADI
jgi:hypothetical protein